MALEILDPTGEREAVERPLAPRGTTPRTIALLDIRKPRGDVFLDELERLLAERGYGVHRTAKPTFTKPAPADVRREIAANCDAVIEALAD
ncbi:MAG: selenoprotein [Solirubrobacterales bacterium]|nr:selenoprotein [Solirubrobacterales bacterium]